MGKSMWVVIAAYNEARKIASVIQSLRRTGYRNIIVVDDGSKDATTGIAERAGASVIRHPLNRGQGAALKTGIDAALLHGADYIVTFDADGQHDAAEIEDLLAPIRRGEADITLGSRFLTKKSDIPMFKQMVLKGGILFTRLFSGIALTDTHNGFRALSRKAAQRIEIRQDRMEHASEIIDELMRKKLRYREIPVTIKYTEYSIQHGQSPFNSIKIALNLILRKLAR